MIKIKVQHHVTIHLTEEEVELIRRTLDTLKDDESTPRGTWNRADDIQAHIRRALANPDASLDDEDIYSTKEGITE